MKNKGRGNLFSNQEYDQYLKLADKINTLDTLNLWKKKNKKTESKPVQPDLQKLMQDIKIDAYG